MDAPTERPKDPWEYMVIIAKAAQDSGTELSQAFRFMAAMSLAMASAKAAPTNPESTSKPS